MTTVHRRQLQQYTQDNLKLATIHTRQIRIQHVQKVQTPKQDSTVYSFLLLFYFQSLNNLRFHPSPSLLITYYSYKPFPLRLVLPPISYTVLHFTSFHFTWGLVLPWHTWSAAGLSAITSDASFRARDAFISPSAAITFARASRAASASAAIARWSCKGRRTSFL